MSTEPTEPVPAAYDKRIDSEEPWRYECPECDSVDVMRYTFQDRRRGRRYTASAAGKQEAKRDLQAPYFCNQCGERLHEVYDKKEDRCWKP